MKYITAILVTLPFSALSATHCFYNLSNVDVCKQAAKMANEIKSDLPLNVSKDVSLYAVEVKDNKLIAYVRLNYSEYDALKIYPWAKKSWGFFKNQWRDTVTAFACGDENSLKSFVRMGGELQYIYSFINGDPYDSFSIVYCK